MMVILEANGGITSRALDNLMGSEVEAPILRIHGSQGEIFER